MRIVLDESRCASTGVCESVAPDVFEIEDDGMLTVLETELEESRRGEITAACEACPTGALRIEG